jgi:hypothetical protein
VATPVRIDPQKGEALSSSRGVSAPLEGPLIAWAAWSEWMNTTARDEAHVDSRGSA